MSSLQLNSKLLKTKKTLYYNTTGANGNIILTENPIESKTIEIEYSADGVTSQIRFAYKPNVKFSLPLFYINASNNHMQFNSTYTMNGLNITFNNANNNYINASSVVNSYSFASYIKINKVTMFI